MNQFGIRILCLRIRIRVKHSRNAAEIIDQVADGNTAGKRHAARAGSAKLQNFAAAPG